MRFRAPTSEQLRITDQVEELLSDLDAATTALRRVKEKLNLYRASVLNSAVEGDLSADWRVKNPGAEPAPDLLKRILVERGRRWEEDQLTKSIEAGRMPPNAWRTKYKLPVASSALGLAHLPAGWCVTSFDAIAEIQGGLQKSPSRVPKKNHYPYLRVANVNRDSLDLSHLERFELTDAELRRLRLRAGDILVVEGNGSRSEIGRCALWNGEIADCVHQNHIIRIRPFSGVLPKFIDIFLNSPIGQQAIQSVASSTSGLYTLSISKIARLPIALPPLDEQQLIAETVDDHFSIIDHLEFDLASKIESSQVLRHSVLRHAFAGKLVTQAPNDEPASELLDRIAAERKACERQAAIRTNHLKERQR